MSGVLLKEKISSEQNIQPNEVPAVGYFIAAAILAVGVYLSQLVHLLEKPVFSHIYYGNLNTAFFYTFGAVLIFGYTVIFHIISKKKLSFSPFGKKGKEINIKRRAVLYVMTAVPIIATAAALNFRFKIIYELGEKITGMTLLGNAVGYLYVAAKLFALVYFTALVQKGFERLFGTDKFPVGGIAAAIVFGLFEILFGNSLFTPLYIFLYVYFGLIYTIAKKRFGTTYALSMMLFVL